MKRMVDFRGKKVEGTVVGFKPIEEPWQEYQLNDGSVLRIKYTIIEVVRIDGEYTEDGDPVYSFKSVPPTSRLSYVPDQLRKRI